MAFVKVVEGSEIYNFRIQGLVHFYSKICSYSYSNRGTMKRNCASWAAPRRRARPPAAWCPRIVPPRCPRQCCAARGHSSTEAAPSPRACAPRLLGVRTGPASPIVRTVPAGRTPRTAGLSAASRRTRTGRGRRTRAAYSRSRHRHHRSSPPLFKDAFHPRVCHHCHSHRHDRRLSDLPFFRSVSSPADTPNTSSSSHVSRSLCLWASRKPPSPTTPPAAAAAAGPRRAPTLAISLPKLRPPLGPR
jgi:hypothetical protein